MKPKIDIRISGAGGSGAGQSIGKQALDRFLSLTLTDVRAYETDTLSLSFDWRPPFPALPKRKGVVEVWLGYEGSAEVTVTYIPMTKMGTFEINDVSFSGPPWTVTLECSAIRFVSESKQQRNLVYEDTTLDKVVTEIAQRIDCTPKIHPSFKKVKIDYLPQKNVSDLAFLNMLAASYNANPKMGSGGKDLLAGEGVGRHRTLYFMPKNASRPVDVIVSPDMIEPGSFDYNDTVRGLYGAVVASSYSFDNGKLDTVEVPTGQTDSEGNKVTAKMELSAFFEASEKAQSAAESKVAALGQDTKRCSFKMGGNPLILADKRLQLVGEFPPDIHRDWIVAQAVHTFSKKAGYTTAVQLSLPLPGAQ